MTAVLVLRGGDCWRIEVPSLFNWPPPTLSVLVHGWPFLAGCGVVCTLDRDGAIPIYRQVS